MIDASNPRILFLMDGLGAACSCFLLGVILNGHPDFFGVPPDVVTLLSLFAAALSVSAFLCYCFSKKNVRWLLTVMGIGNLVYCLVTIVMLAQAPEKIKWPGVFYFSGELSLLVILVSAEWRAGRAAG